MRMSASLCDNPRIGETPPPADINLTGDSVSKYQRGVFRLPSVLVVNRIVIHISGDILTIVIRPSP
ncbi:MAG: hypothetical protein AB2725_16720 [Candidatus Thiodiazotropha endolucinida]